MVRFEKHGRQLSAEPNLSRIKCEWPGLVVLWTDLCGWLPRYKCKVMISRSIGSGRPLPC